MKRSLVWIMIQALWLRKDWNKHSLSYDRKKPDEWLDSQKTFVHLFYCLLLA